MPNHLHGVIEIRENDNQTTRGKEFQPTLGQIIAYFKYQSTKEINLMRRTPGASFWQRNYYEHIIRNEDDYRMIYDYIQYNPVRWKEDKFYFQGA